MAPITLEHSSASSPAPSTGEPRLSLRGVSKTFGGVRVLHDVDVDIAPGEVHGLVGQNGSGKSTLIKVLSGFHQADRGSRLSIDGTLLDSPIRPAALRQHGVAFVHQDLGLVPAANVVENVKVGQYTVGRFSRRIQWQQDAREVASVLHTLGASSVDPFASVDSLDHGQRASVAIARAMLGITAGTGCVVFDESTQSLPREILGEFYAQVRRLAASGTSVLLVSHRLEEVLALCDTVTVLQDGRVSLPATSTRDLTETELTRRILGGARRATGASAPASTGPLRQEPDNRPDNGPADRPGHDPGQRVALVAKAVHGGRVRGAATCRSAPVRSSGSPVTANPGTTSCRT